MRSSEKIPMISKLISVLLILALAVDQCSALATINVKGSAAKPYEKKKVVVFGAGGYLGGCIFGFLQRCGSLYGTGINGIGSPRAVVATPVGSLGLNGVLSKNFILAQADESFVRLTDMTSVATIKPKLDGYQAAFMATRYTLEKRPVAMGSYDKSPNDKTNEFYMEKPQSSNIVSGRDDPEYSMQIFVNSLEACKEAGVKKLIVVETDNEFGDANAGDKYIKLLDSTGIPYTYVQPSGKFETSKDFTYAKGVQGGLNVEVVDSANLSLGDKSGEIYREDLAAFCVQCLLSLSWDSKEILRVTSEGSVPVEAQSKQVQKEWCVNSDKLQNLLGQIA